MTPYVVLFQKDGSLISRLISIITKSPYTHAGILFNGYLFDASESRGRVGVDQSLSMYGDRVISVYRLYGINDISKWLLLQVGRKYDYIGVLGWLLRWNKPEDVYCFEWVSEAIAKAKGLPIPTRDRTSAQDVMSMLSEVVYHGPASKYGKGS